MGNLLLALRTALAIIPQVIECIKAIEVPGNGAAKAAVIIKIIDAAFDLLPEEVKKVLDMSRVGQYAQKVVDLIVTFLNATGYFKHS